ncbi:hypothetical protein GYMLUDRAFT_61591 [Collybiopsis luxurians FD-317 M1]|uniref:Uncharacterized protein n=1 Tax=Collybiopsis luxurians FD-317 M1 TaxID=944289 RepID=A0A0D0CFW5_9AGAR|nr:hypothetical protein GYMLUDRAFT_61591 [Collybiopsis luxurians FD-317 M1]
MTMKSIPLSSIHGYAAVSTKCIDDHKEKSLKTLASNSSAIQLKDTNSDIPLQTTEDPVNNVENYEEGANRLYIIAATEPTKIGYDSGNERLITAGRSLQLAVHNWSKRTFKKYESAELEKGNPEQKFNLGRVQLR